MRAAAEDTRKPVFIHTCHLIVVGTRHDARIADCAAGIVVHIARASGIDTVPVKYEQLRRSIRIHVTKRKGNRPQISGILIPVAGARRIQVFFSENEPAVCVLPGGCCILRRRGRIKLDDIPEHSAVTGNDGNDIVRDVI